MQNEISFEISTSGRNDGTLEAVYIQILDAVVHATKEIKPDVMLADYTDDGRLIGIEILSPVKLSELERVVKQQKLRKNFRRFVEASAPREMVTA